MGKLVEHDIARPVLTVRNYVPQSSELRSVDAGTNRA
jgi:hypothetical protein